MTITSLVTKIGQHRLARQESTPISGRYFCLGSLCCPILVTSEVIVSLFTAWALPEYFVFQLIMKFLPMMTIVVYNLLISRKLYEFTKKRRAMEEKAALRITERKEKV